MSPACMADGLYGWSFPRNRCELSDGVQERGRLWCLGLHRGRVSAPCAAHIGLEASKGPGVKLPSGDSDEHWWESHRQFLEVSPHMLDTSRWGDIYGRSWAYANEILLRKVATPINRPLCTACCELGKHIGQLLLSNMSSMTRYYN